MTTVIAFGRMQKFATTGSAGVVKDTIFARCFWAPLEKPVAIFAPGSSGIQVLGHVRNVVFPDDTVFLDAVPDAYYPAELATIKAAGKPIRFVELGPALSQTWWIAYQAAATQVLKDNPRAAIHGSQNPFFQATKTITDGADGYVVVDMTPQQAKTIVAADAVKVG